MIAWLQALTVGEVITALFALGALLGGTKWLGPILRDVTHFLRDWAGEPERPGVPAKPGVMEQIAQLRCDVEGIKNDLGGVKDDAASAAFNSKSNHGGSSHDALIRRLDELVRNYRKQDGRLAAIERAVRQSVEDRAEIREHVGLDPHEPEEPKQEDA